MNLILNDWLSPVSGELELKHMLVRAFLAYIFSFFFFRIAGMRTFGRLSLSDHITILTLGAIIGRSVVTSQPFFPSMLAVLLIVLLHRSTTWLAFRNKKMGVILKGKPLLLIHNGNMIYENMKQTDISEHDLMACVRLRINSDDISLIKEAYLERSGEVSVVLK